MAASMFLVLQGNCRIRCGRVFWDFDNPLDYFNDNSIILGIKYHPWLEQVSLQVIGASRFHAIGSLQAVLGDLHSIGGPSVLGILKKASQGVLLMEKYTHCHVY